MISMKYNTIMSYYAKSAMKEKKGLNIMSFYKTQELKNSILIRSGLKFFDTFSVLH